MARSRKDLLGLKGVPAEEIQEILKNAKMLKQLISQPSKKASHLSGKTVITLFYENSTRTRMSFELAGKYLSANVANISASASSVQKGETLIDTGKTLDVMGTDVIVIRHPMSGAPHLLAKNVKASVINAGDGINEHPTQALLDMFTMKEKLGDLKGLEVAILGDIYHSRVARSNIFGLTTMGAHVTVCGPGTLLPGGIEKLGASATLDARAAVRNADVVMALRIQRERQKGGLFPSVREYHQFYGVDEELLSLARPHALVMHPGPVNRGVELTSSVDDGEQSVITEQVTNGVAVRMALLYLLTRRA
ncbi:aspartate carbamoyltransferase catalytic subunit [Christensenellaceae bacterium NSJ-63]|uniref:Aspartate carbamoyltransferase n=1 Tax=Guopingia tenuis TaxID=2763656 RepID=A0A926DIY6_9FIRM|nr:aspartate carbamoyltransferase catalytic subunit [Guopingia tenuis]MBC8538614.1 aspartate carbamoyltransferase catalytic subunit [Guopingia tenuis]